MSSDYKDNLELRDVLIACPVCGSQKTIKVPKKEILEKETGTTSIFIPKGFVCEHKYYAYVDKNFMVRDYLVLEYSLKDEASRIKELKEEIISKGKEIIHNKEQLLQFISEKDLASLLYACFIGSPILFIEEHPYSERFTYLFTFLAKLFPKCIEMINIFSPDKFLDYEKENIEKLKLYTVYNTMYKISVQKPFLDSEAEVLFKILDKFSKGNPKVQIILAKNELDYLKKFAKEIETKINQKNEKIAKIFKKKYPKQSKFFEVDYIEIMKKRIRFQKKLN